MTRDHYKGVPRVRPVSVDNNNNLVVVSPAVGNIPLNISPFRSHNALSFGAKGGGTVDDTTAIQKAIDAACQDSSAGTGAIVFLPALLYKVTRPLRIYKDNVWIIGSNRRATRIQFWADEPYDPTLLLYEADPLETLLNCGLAHVELRAINNTTRVKYAIDLHAVRKFHMHDVAVQAWSDTTKSSVALRIRGWDNITIERCALTADFPVVIGKNDDGAGGFLDDTKDLDHCRILNSELVADNEEKIAIKIDSGVVYRNLTFRGMAFVHGGIRKKDLEVPRRRSTNLLIADARFEGFAETDGDVEGKYAIDLQHHVNGQLRNLTVENVLLAEGSDDRYGANTPANWNGIRTVGVWRSILIEGTYSGGKIPITCSGSVPKIFSGQWTEQDFGRAIPECEAQWDQLGIPCPRSWWNFSADSGNPSDQQDADVSGLVDRPLVAAGSPGYQQFYDGWHGYQAGFTEALGQRFGLQSANTEFSPQDRSVAWLAYYCFPVGWVPAGKRILITMGSPAQSGASGPNIYINESGFLETYAGSTVVTGTVNYLDHSCAFLGVYNRTTSEWITYGTTINEGTMETITGTYSASPGNTNPKGFGAPDTYTSCSGTLRFGAMWLNEDAEELDGETLVKLGWDINAHDE